MSRNTASCWKRRSRRGGYERSPACAGLLVSLALPSRAGAASRADRRTAGRRVEGRGAGGIRSGGLRGRGAAGLIADAVVRRVAGGRSIDGGTGRGGGRHARRGGATARGR